jgi:hypothetical protein
MTEMLLTIIISLLIINVGIMGYLVLCVIGMGDIQTRKKIKLFESILGEKNKRKVTHRTEEKQRKTWDKKVAEGGWETPHGV